MTEPLERDTPMTRTYITVVVMEAVTIMLLWWIGHSLS